MANHYPFTGRIICMLLKSVMIIFAVFFASNGYAHKSGQSYIFVRIHDTAVDGTFEVTLKDLNVAMGLSTPEEQITLDNLEQRIGQAHAYYRERVQFYDGEKQLPIRFMEFKTRKLKIGQYVLLRFSLIENGPPPDAIDIDYNILFDKVPDHLGLLVIEHFWNANLFNNERQVALIFSPSEQHQRLSLSDHTRLGGFLGIVKMGIKHIMKGIDHILFLIALILPAAMLRRGDGWEPVSSFRPALFYTVKVVTLFTIAHTITLSMAALGVFNLPSRLVESIIAISIIITALNIIYPIFSRKIGWVVFIFGLFHGFGFAGVLSQLGVLGEHMVLSLFGFNLGVEIGQIAVIGFLFPIIYGVRRFSFYPNFVLRYGSMAMILVASLWLVERAFLDESVAQMLKDSYSMMVK